MGCLIILTFPFSKRECWTFTWTPQLGQSNCWLRDQRKEGPVIRSGNVGWKKWSNWDGSCPSLMYQWKKDKKNFFLKCKNTHTRIIPMFIFGLELDRPVLSSVSCLQPEKQPSLTRKAWEASKESLNYITDRKFALLLWSPQLWHISKLHRMLTT